jgi:hypothetical protein
MSTIINNIDSSNNNDNGNINGNTNFMAMALGDHHHPLTCSKCEWRGSCSIQGNNGPSPAPNTSGVVSVLL